MEERLMWCRSTEDISIRILKLEATLKFCLQQRQYWKERLAETEKKLQVLRAKKCETRRDAERDPKTPKKYLGGEENDKECPPAKKNFTEEDIRVSLHEQAVPPLTMVKGVEVPLDLLREILLRLPVKSLFRFRCVSKLWNRVITDPLFVESHHQHARSRAHGLLSLRVTEDGWVLRPGPVFHGFSYN